MSEEFLQSGEVLLEIAKSEYQNEFNRSSVLDTKIGIALPIIATYFFLILQYKSVRQLFITNPDCTNIMTLILSVCIPIIFVAAIISAAIALIYLFRAIVTHSYQTIDPCYFNDKCRCHQVSFQGLWLHITLERLSIIGQQMISGSLCINVVGLRL